MNLVNIGYQALTGHKTAMNRAVSYHLKEAVTGTAPDYGIEFGKAIFSRGELLVSWVLEVLCLVDALLSVKWENGSGSVFCKGSDKVSFVVYNPEREAFVTFQDVGERLDKAVVLQLPETFTGNTIHTWMHYRNTEGNMVSTSVYLGPLMVV